MTTNQLKHVPGKKVIALEKINFRHSAEQYDRWVKAYAHAKRAGKVGSLSEWVRGALEKAAEEEEASAGPITW